MGHSSNKYGICGKVAMGQAGISPSNSISLHQFSFHRFSVFMLINLPSYHTLLDTDKCHYTTEKLRTGGRKMHQHQPVRAKFQELQLFLTNSYMS
jgi:hypothetical protein